MRRRTRSDDNFAREIEAHIALETDRLVAEDMPPNEARRAATRAFGNVTRVREQFYESRRVGWLDDGVRDLRYATRTFARNPRFTLVAILTLALGIGANTAVFSVLDAVLLRPLPYARPSELVSFTPGTYDAFREWASGVRSLRASGACTYSLANVTGGHEPVRVWTLAVTASLLPTLGVAPVIGHGFTGDDDVARPVPRVLLRYPRRCPLLVCRSGCRCRPETGSTCGWPGWRRRPDSELRPSPVERSREERVERSSCSSSAWPPCPPPSPRSPTPR